MKMQASLLLAVCLSICLAYISSSDGSCVSPSDCTLEAESLKRHARSPSSFIEQVIPLPFPQDALAPHISEETVHYHYDKHHKGYAVKLDDMAKTDPSLPGKTIHDLVISAKGTIYNLAAQVLNHNYYWTSLSPQGGGEPSGALLEAIKASFGSFDKFKGEFTKQAAGHFGSGWVWLVREEDSNTLSVVATHDGDCPVSKGLVPMLVIDVWEHAYYIDYRNVRTSYIDHFWNLVNWDFAESKLLNLEEN